MIENAADKFKHDADYNHKFMEYVAQLHEAGDQQAIDEERIILKLLQLSPDAQEGFITNDYPTDIKSAEIMEEYKGGLNAFVHLTLPDSVLYQLEEVRF